MSSPMFITVGVAVAWERVDHPWQTERWKPISVFLNPPECTQWRELVRSHDAIQYHAANLQLELHRKETAAYQVNLTHGEPVVYVVLRQSEDPAHPFPVKVHSVTVSPFEAQAHGYGTDEIVEGVAMPPQLRDLVEAFIAEHHVEQPFVKRQRVPASEEDPYLFGQEPLHELRRRQEGRGV